MKKETRVLASSLKVEKREDGMAKISGYAAVFNKDSEDMGFIERIRPGAFKKALKKSDVRALFNHDPSLIIGRSGVNLELKEDKKGLWMEVSPIPTETYRMVAENIASGLVSQQSFGFTVADDEWDKDYRTRTINEIDELFDVSPVTYPAYPDTDVALRSRDKAKTEKEPDETITIEIDEDSWTFRNVEQLEQVADKITALFDKAGDESPSTDTDPEESRDNSDEAPSSEPQTVDQLEERFKNKLESNKGLYGPLQTKKEK